jgi:hypothetical protein
VGSSEVRFQFAIFKRMPSIASMTKVWNDADTDVLYKHSSALHSKVPWNRGRWEKFLRGAGTLVFEI